MTQNYGYGAQNPYDQRDPAPQYSSYDGGYSGGDNNYSQQGQQGYGQPQQQQPSYGRQGYGGQGQPSLDGGYAGSGVELQPLAQNGASVGRSGDPNAVLNECRDIDRGIDTVERNLEQLRMLQQRTLDDADASGSSAANRQLDGLSTETMALYRSLTERVRQVKSIPEANSPKNKAQVGRVDRRLKDAIRSYQSVESSFRKRTQEQMARQYRIVRPEASEQEVRAAVEDTSSNGQVFQQALMHSDRQGRARAALSAVQDRHDALVKIEQQIVELAQLFQDMDTLVVQQEEAVQNIEQKGEEVVDNLDKGNEEMRVAVNTSRATRKKKWICLGISVAIVVIVVVIVVIYFLVIKGDGNGGGGNGGAGGSSKRDTANIELLPFISPVINSRVVRSQDAVGEMSRLLRERVRLPQQLQ
ncbi:syntaxin [Emericellopsis atlantica]|uniref:Syntaxin n=1 Tax=Emericellopsis atlantica TaxID=2614577 RepID=A0A9P7ZQS3_9HYPO|nr:syntaxin [Emericellopsis atlantica]KAG9256082.1 syntaxin [Emericellopsis atlantica]